MLDPQAKPSAEDIVLLLQRALILLGSTSHAISLERRRVACTRINPKLKPIASEEFADRKDQLFGPGFLEKASKRLEADKALEKVTDPGISRKRTFQNDSEDPQSFFYPRALLPSTAAGKSSAFHSHTEPSRHSTRAQRIQNSVRNNGSPRDPRPENSFANQFIYCRKGEHVYGSLGRHYKGSMDPGGSGRLLPGAGVQAISVESNAFRASAQISKRSHRERNTNTLAEESDRGGVSVAGPVCDSQEGWLISPNAQLEAIEPVHQEVALQDGGNGYSEGIGAVGRLVLYNRPERCLSVSGSEQGTQRKDLSVYMSPVQTQQCSEVIYEAASTGDDLSAGVGPQVSHILGRPFIDG